MPEQNTRLGYTISQLLSDKNNVVIFSFVQNLLCGHSLEFMTH